MSNGLFFTGTDTGCGKTTAAIAYMNQLKHANIRVAGFKPVSAGCERLPEGLRHSDAVKLQNNASVEFQYNIINPYAFEPAVAPHIGAQLAGIKMDIDTIVGCYQTLSSAVDQVIVEGAGGWLVPINTRQTMADVAKALNIDVILVVGMKLGCLNHALLTYQSILNHDCRVAGWIANILDPHMPNLNENIHYLENNFDSPLVRILNHDCT